MIKRLTSIFSLIIAFFLNTNYVYGAVNEWGDCVVGGVPTLKCIEVVFGNIIFMSTGLVILILFIMLVIGAFYFLTSAGNPEGIKKAVGTIKFAVIGLLLFMGTFLILKIIDTLFLGGAGKIFRFEIGP